MRTLLRWLGIANERGQVQYLLSKVNWLEEANEKLRRKIEEENEKLCRNVRKKHNANQTYFGDVDLRLKRIERMLNLSKLETARECPFCNCKVTERTDVGRKCSACKCRWL